MAKNLLIVESPAKAKTIGKYLGPDFEVMASVGHIIDLPKKRLGVDIESDFAPEYVPIEGKEKVINSLKKAAKGKEVVYLGPDPDREGEAIAWHIADSLGMGKFNFKRVLFHELTPQAVEAALKSPVDLSRTRFDSQQTRRILDRLVGYLISPVLWEKLKRGLSAGRVQSVALRILVERERVIQAFAPEEYWTVSGFFKSGDKVFEAQLNRRGNEKIDLKNEAEAGRVLRDLDGAGYVVESLVAKDRKRSPSPPFTTSTLQQAAFNRHRFDPAKTMRIAQALYEGVELPGGTVGLITYMRTDSVRVSDQASLEAREHARKNFGRDYAPASANRYANKKGAQDAHEAVRPSSVERAPDKLRGQMDREQWLLYDLIWRRFVASQMTPASVRQTTADIAAGEYRFRATGSVVTFKGFLAVYDPMTEEDKNTLPRLEEGQRLALEKIEPRQHFTQPPARFNEATLVKELEERGIGRPSTYASIISVLRAKEYVEARRGQLRPSEMGMMVNDLLVASFPRIMDVAFTADLEEDLDEIEEGGVGHLEVLKKLYTPLADNLSTAKASMPNVKIAGLPVDVACPGCGQKGGVSIRYGRNGFYLSCAACGHTADFSRDEKGNPTPVPPITLGEECFCDVCGKPMVPKKGPYGSFLACAGYPECRNTKPLTRDRDGNYSAASKADVPPLPEGMDPSCPKCGRPLAVKLAKKGNYFISCTGYPKCRTAFSFPTGFKCPKPGCGGDLSERPSRKGAFFGCSNYPECRVIISGTPAAEPCPECDFPYVVVSNRKSAQGKKYCPNPDCPTNSYEDKERPSSPAWFEGRAYENKASSPASRTRTAAAKTSAAAKKTAVMTDADAEAKAAPKKTAAAGTTTKTAASKKTAAAGTTTKTAAAGTRTAARTAASKTAAARIKKSPADEDGGPEKPAGAAAVRRRLSAVKGAPEDD
jgi:DNA topoisomerase-1